MPIEFPKVDEVRLAAPPLDEVVCQVRHPTILGIIAGEPIEFQNHIRETFPEFQKQHTFQFQLPTPGNPAAPSTENQATSFVFSDLKRQLQATLSPTSYAVSMKKYEGWDSFLQALEIVHTAFVVTYQPAYASRIGLRYINRLTTENTGASSREELINLVRPELTYMLHGEVWDNVSEMVGIINFNDPPAKMNIRFGYETNGQEQMPAFLLDFDYYEEGRIDLNEVLSRCQYYHEVIYRAFRWVVKDETLKRFQGGA